MNNAEDQPNTAYFKLQCKLNLQKKSSNNYIETGTTIEPYLAATIIT